MDKIYMIKFESFILKRIERERERGEPADLLVRSSCIHI